MTNIRHKRENISLGHRQIARQEDTQRRPQHYNAHAISRYTTVQSFEPRIVRNHKQHNNNERIIEATYTKHIPPPTYHRPKGLRLSIYIYISGILKAVLGLSHHEN